MKLINSNGVVEHELALHHYDMVDFKGEDLIIRLKGQYPKGIQMFCDRVFFRDSFWHIYDRTSDNSGDYFSIRMVEN